MHIQLLRTLVFLLLLVLSCSRAPVREGTDQGPEAEPYGNGAIFGPPPPPDATLTEGEAEFLDEPQQLSPFETAYVLVLGPGLGRTLAYVGVLQELEKKKIDIRAVVGVEMGSMIGAIWASGDANVLEWELHKFKKDMLLDFPLFNIVGDRVAEGKKLYKYLSKAIKVPSLEKMKRPVVIVSSTDFKSGGDLLVERKGSAKDIVRGAISIPGVIEEHSWGSVKRMTASMETPFPAKQARALGLGRVLCVDVLGNGSSYQSRGSDSVIEDRVAALMKPVSILAREQLKSCDSVIQIPAEKFGYLDFESRAELIYQGRLAVQRWLHNNPYK